MSDSETFSQRLSFLLNKVLDTGKIPQKENTQKISENDFSENVNSNNGDKNDFAENANQNNSDKNNFSENANSNNSDKNNFSENANQNSFQKNKTTDKKSKNFYENFNSKNKPIGQIVKNGKYNQIPLEVIEAFEILECPPTFVYSQIRTAFRKKIKEVHPDFSETKTIESQNIATQKIIAAKKIIENWLNI